MNGRRHPARTATLAIGGTLMGLAILGAGFGGAAALAMPDQWGMTRAIPDGTTAVEIATGFTNIWVEPGSDGDGRSYAYLDEGASTMFGAVPRISLTTTGATTVISIDDEEQQQRFGIGAATLHVYLNEDVLDSLTIRGGGYDLVDGGSARRLLIDSDSATNLDLGNARAEDVVLTGSGTFRVTTAGGDEWLIAEPDWYESWAGQQRQQMGVASACSTEYPDIPAVCVTSTATADRTIDFRGIDRGAWVSIRDR